MAPLLFRHCEIVVVVEISIDIASWEGAQDTLPKEENHLLNQPALIDGSPSTNRVSQKRSERPDFEPRSGGVRVVR
jgi:hypothetical protein